MTFSVYEFLKLFKELVMENGFWNVVLGLSLLIIVFNVSWRLPAILAVIKDWYGGKE